MAEELSSRAFEGDIAELAHSVEEKRASVEREAGIIPEDEREMVRAALIQKTAQTGTTAQPTPPSSQKSQKSYLDDLSLEDQQSVRELLALVETKGINEALKEAEMKTPYLLDVFHDELTDKLYNVLKERGHIK